MALKDFSRPSQHVRPSRGSDAKQEDLPAVRQDEVDSRSLRWGYKNHQ